MIASPRFLANPEGGAPVVVTDTAPEPVEPRHVQQDRHRDPMTLAIWQQYRAHPRNVGLAFVLALMVISMPLFCMGRPVVLRTAVPGDVRSDGSRLVMAQPEDSSLREVWHW